MKTKSFMGVFLALFIAALPCAAQCSESNNVDYQMPDLLAWYLITNPSQSVTVQDCTGNGHSGSFIGSQQAKGSWPAWGHVDFPLFPISQSFTITSWETGGGVYPPYESSANPAPPPASYDPILVIGTPQSGLYLGLDQSNESFQIVINYSNGTDNNMYGSCIGGTADGNLHFIAATFDGNSAYLYVDNVQVAGPCKFSSGKWTSSVTQMTARMGCWTDGSNTNSCPQTGGSFFGSISGIRIYKGVHRDYIADLWSGHIQ